MSLTATLSASKMVNSAVSNSENGNGKCWLCLYWASFATKALPLLLEMLGEYCESFSFVLVAFYCSCTDGKWELGVMAILYDLTKSLQDHLFVGSFPKWLHSHG